MPEVVEAQRRWASVARRAVRAGAEPERVFALARTAPRTSWPVMRAPATETRVPAPVRDPAWLANRTRGEHE
nr:hypothetical protein [Streptomyces lavendulae]